MNPTEIIRKKRDGETLTREEMRFVVNGFVEGKIPDYQMSAFLMAVYFRGMDFEETTTFTDIMLHSGSVVDLSEIPGIKVDKHSTGGVGDKVSIILAPMVAACDVSVPMISGRGLGHTGGTLDKLESIPGFRTNLSLNEYRALLKKIGLAMIGQTDEIAPADKKMYALRDVTATVECIPLIAGSIMSKKLAEGIDALVLDVKTGRGAFMQSEKQALDLAQTLVTIGKRFGKRTIGFFTSMDQPLGYAVGNWLEVVECVECLQGRTVQDLMELTYVLGGAMVMLGGKAKSITEGIGHCKEAIRSGRAFEKFLELVRAQGGEVSYIEEPSKYKRSNIEREIASGADGYIASIDALEIGFTNIALGAGRMKVDDVIDPKAGILLKKKVGDPVKRGETVAQFFTDNERAVEAAAARLQQAFQITASPPPPQPLLKAMIDDRGVHPWNSG